MGDSLMTYKEMNVKISKKYFLIGKNGCFSGVGVLILSLKKVKIFDFSCMLVTDFTVNVLLKYVAQL